MRDGLSCQVGLSDPDGPKRLAPIMASISEITMCVCVCVCTVGGGGGGSEAELNAARRMRIR